MAATLSNMGKIHKALGVCAEALRYYEEALDILKDTNERDLEARIVNNVRLLREHISKTQSRQPYTTISYYFQSMPARRK